MKNRSVVGIVERKFQRRETRCITAQTGVGSTGIMRNRMICFMCQE